MPKTDEVRYMTNTTNEFIIGINETEIDETILSRELELDGYDLKYSIDQGEVVVLLVTLNLVTKTVFAAISKLFLLIFICQQINNYLPKNK